MSLRRSTESLVDRPHFAGPSIKVELKIRSEIGAISPLVDKLMLLIKETACVPGKENAVEIALREALANAVLHGNRLDADKRVHICCRCCPGREVSFVVKDEGMGFDSTKVPNSLAPENIGAHHGRGIFLMKRFMDEVRFEQGGTEVHMRKGSDTLIW